MVRKNTGAKSDNAPPIDVLCSHYEEVITRYERTFEPWHKRAQKIYDIYSKVKSTGDVGRAGSRMAILWANIGVLQPAVYSRLPLPSVSRRFRDTDPVARVASDMIERCLHYSFDRGDADSVLRKVRDDFLVVGRGTAWVRYEADIETEGGPDADDEDEAADAEAEEPIETLADERVVWDYVHWEDFGHNVCRHWAEVTDVWRKSYLNREELRERFADTLTPEEINAIPLDFKPKEKQAQNDAKSQAIVYEIWSKRRKRVVWFVKGFHKPLEVSRPPLEFDDFFPCPKPAYGTLESGSLVPSPDYAFYQFQLDQIDDLTARIASLTEAVKLVGFYPADVGGDGVSAIEKAAQPGYENKLVPVASWAMFADKGGGGPAIAWWPADMVAKTIDQCIGIRKQLIDDVYQVTGISDIVRGDSAASETATAQQIKTQWGSMRIRDRQMALAAVARDMARLGGEIIAEQFSPETMLRMSNLKLPSRMAVAQARSNESPPVTIEDVVELFRDERLRGYRIDIETDQMIEGDENAEKQRRVELTTAMGQMLQQASAIIASPMGGTLAPMIKSIILFTVRGFKAGRSVEDEIERSFDALVQQLSQPQQPKEDPAAQAEMQKALIEQKRVQIEEAKAAQEMRLAQEKHDADLQSKARHDARSDAETELKIRTQRDEMSARLAEQNLRAHVDQNGEMTEAVNTDDWLRDQILNIAQQGHASNQMVAQALAQLAAVQAAPRRVVRDETGRAIGMEPVPPAQG